MPYTANVTLYTIDELTEKARGLAVDTERRHRLDEGNPWDADNELTYNRFLYTINISPHGEFLQRKLLVASDYLDPEWLPKLAEMGKNYGLSGFWLDGAVVELAEAGVRDPNAYRERMLAWAEDEWDSSLSYANIVDDLREAGVLFYENGYHSDWFVDSAAVKEWEEVVA